MKEKLKKWIVPVVVVIVLLLPIIINYTKTGEVDLIDYSEFESSISSGDVSIVYFGDTKDSDYSKVTENLLSIKSDYDIKVNTLDINELSGEEIENLSVMNTKFENGNVYAVISDNEVRTVVDSKDKDQLGKIINKVINYVIPDDEIAYKTVSTYKAFKKVFDSKSITMHVFGRNSCSWCNRFKPVYNDAATDYKVDIYYYDSDSFNTSEYNKIINLKELYIPKECSSNGAEESLANGFGTPLTIFTKKGKVVGCITGYVNYSGLIEKLKSVKMI